MEERLNTMEKTIENLYKDVDGVKEILKMHIREHIADYQPVHVISMQGKTENGISYSWGNYYRAEINKVQSDESV